MEEGSKDLGQKKSFESRSREAFMVQRRLSKL